VSSLSFNGTYPPARSITRYNMKGRPLVLASGALIMVIQTQTREKKEKVIPSLKELPLA